MLTIRTDSRMVNLPVVVREKHGKIVKNVQKDDLLLTEDGQPQTIRYFDHDTSEPLTLGLLVDVSISEQNSLAGERDASKDFLHHMLEKQDNAFLIQFAREVDLLSQPTGDHDALKAALAKLAPPTPIISGDSNDPIVHYGGTHLYDAIFLAADEVMKKESNRKAIIVLTDGEDTASKESLEQTIEAAQRADTIVYAIYYPNKGGGKAVGQKPIHIGSGTNTSHFAPTSWADPGTVRSDRALGGRKQHADGRAILTRITGETGGTIFEVSDKQSIGAIYKEIAEELRTQYRLSYTPPVHSAPGLHTVAVTAKNTQFTVQTRSGYYSTK